MSKFETVKIDLGYVKPGQVLKPVFKLVSEEGPKEFSTTCHCIKPRYNKSIHSVEVTYTVTDIPYHLIQSGVRELPQAKVATVIFVDGTKEDLTFNYIIKK